MPDRSADPSHAAEWLAVLRIAVGLYFAKAVITKLTIVLAGGVVPVPAVSDRWLAPATPARSVASAAGTRSCAGTA